MQQKSAVGTSLGMTSASGQSVCADALGQVRRLHEARLSRDPNL